MKKLTHLFLGIFLVSTFFSCFPDPGSSKNLDEDLFGKWVYYENDQSIAASWTFNDDATCVQYLGGQYYDWLWEIEDGELKRFVEGGIPNYMTYNIEGNFLYFYIDAVGEWGLPFTKID